MQEMLGRAGLRAIEGVRDVVSARAGRRISRAAIARRCSLNDATLTRGLSSVPPRLSTVVRYAAGMLGAAIDLVAEEPASMSTQPFTRDLAEAARQLAFAVGDLSSAKPAEIRRARRIRAALDALDEILLGCFGVRVRREAALARVVGEWLDSPEDHAMRLAAISCALAIVTRDPALQGAAHAS